MFTAICSRWVCIRRRHRKPRRKSFCGSMPLKKGEDIQNPRGWIFRVAHNLGLKMRARQNSEEPFDPDLEARSAARTPTPERELLERERMTRFHPAVEGLSRAAAPLPVPAHGRPAVSGNRVRAGDQRFSAVGEFLRRAMARLKKVRDE